MKKLLSLLIAVAVAAGLFAGCAGSEENGPANAEETAGTQSVQEQAAGDNQDALILWQWPNQGNMDVFQDYAAPLIKEKTGRDLEIVVKPMDGQWSTYLNTCVAAIAAGEQVDIIASAIEGHQFFLSKGVMEPLDDFIAADPEGQAHLDQLVPLSLEAFQADGKQYQIPFSLEMMVIWYNLDMFAQAGIEPIDPARGWTWEEFREVSRKLTNDDDGNKIYGAGLNLGAAFQDYPWFLTNGADMLSEDFSQAMFDTPEFIQSVEFLNTLINEDHTCPAPDASSQLTMEEMFKAERVAMTNIGGWAVAGMMRDFEGRYGVAPWPKPTGGDANPSTVYGMCSLAIYNKSGKKDDAWEAIKILSSEGIAEKLWTVGGQSPAVASLLAGDLAKEQYPVGVETWTEITKNMSVIPSPVVFPEIEKIYSRNLLAVFNGQITVEDAVKAMQTESEGVLHAG